MNQNEPEAMQIADKRVLYAIRAKNAAEFEKVDKPLRRLLHAELCRLHAINGELLEALRMMTAHYCNLVNSKKAGHWEPDAEPEVQFARAAIAKATKD